MWIFSEEGDSRKSVRSFFTIGTTGDDILGVDQEAGKDITAGVCVLCVVCVCSVQFHFEI